MRLLFAALGLSTVIGCSSGHATRGSTWPRLHVDETDGGESLAPHQASAVAVEKTPEPAEKAAAAEKAEKAAEKTGGTSLDTLRDAAVNAAPSTTNDDPLQTDDITIEIDGD